MKKTIRFFILILLSIIIACIIGYQIDKNNINGTGGYLLGDRFSSNDILYREIYDYKTNKKISFASNSFTRTENNYLVKNKTSEKNVFYAVSVNKSGIIISVIKGIKLNKYDDCYSIKNSLKIQLENKYSVKNSNSDQINKNNRSITLICQSTETQKIHENYLLSIDYHNDEFLTKDYFKKRETIIKGDFGFYLGSKINNFYKFSEENRLKNGNKKFNVEALYIEDDIIKTLDTFSITTDKDNAILYIKAIKEDIEDCNKYRDLFFDYYWKKYMAVGNFTELGDLSAKTIVSGVNKISLECKKNEYNGNFKFTIFIGAILGEDPDE